MLSLDPRTTALVLIDLQKGVFQRPLAPRPGEEALAAGKKLAQRFRTARANVVLVRVAFADDFSDAPGQAVDQPMALPPGGLPPDWTEFAEGLVQPQDITITKRQWGAFYGTELDLQLRRRGVSTIVLGGIATNFGVELTAREAWEHGYDVVLAEDACASVSVELHEAALQHIFPRIARVVQSPDIVLEAKG